MSTKDMLDIAKERFVSYEDQRAQAAALIAIAEELRTLNATLHDMTDLNGAAKVTLAHDTVIKIAQ